MIASIHAVAGDSSTTYQRILSLGACVPCITTFVPITIATTSALLATQPVMPMYTVEDLEKLKVVQLIKICRLYNIRTGACKANTITNIVTCSTSLNTNLGQLLQLANHIRDHPLSDPAPLHNVYKKHFNYVDLIDRKWYEVEEHHGNHNW